MTRNARANPLELALRHARRRGFTLVEMLCVMVLLAVLGAVLALLLRQTFEVERIQTRSFDRLLQTRTIVDRFRADVAQAIEAPAQFEEQAAAPSTLILKMKSGNHVLYLWREGALQREERIGREFTERELPVDRQRVAIEFVRPTEKGKLVRMHLHTLRAGKTLEGQTLEITASLGGDWR